MSTIITNHTYQIAAPLELVSQFILTPERILDYSPKPIEGGVFKEGEMIWIWLNTGVTLIERTTLLSDQNKITTRVTVSDLKNAPRSADEIKSNALMTLYEDWVLTVIENGTEIEKSWRDLIKHKNTWLPMGMMIRTSVKNDGARLVPAWNKAAQQLLQTAA